MKMLAFARRTGKEILRDPLTVLFGLGFPVILILLLSAIQASIPVPLFEPDRLTPGITVFGLAFMTLEVRESNLPAIRLYEKHGFAVVGKRKNNYDLPKEDALLMTCFMKRGTEI